MFREPVHKSVRASPSCLRPRVRNILHRFTVSPSRCPNAFFRGASRITVVQAHIEEETKQRSGQHLCPGQSLLEISSVIVVLPRSCALRLPSQTFNFCQVMSPTNFLHLFVWSPNEKPTLCQEPKKLPPAHRTTRQGSISSKISNRSKSVVDVRRCRNHTMDPDE